MDHIDENAQMDDTASTSELLMRPQETNKCYKFFQYVTIEPALFLYMMAFMLTTVIEEQFYVDKACKVNLGYNDTICNNINDKNYSDYNKNVQIIASEINQWNNIAGHVVPIILSFFIGSWSDKRGRKLPLLLGLSGKLYYSVMIVVNSLMKTWPAEYIVYTATFPSACTGADVAIFAAAYSYITDISSTENRTMRITILEFCYLITMPTGIALGSFLYNKVTNKSYTIMFSINASLLLLSIIYSFIRVKWRTTNNQAPWREADNMVTDFFDKDHFLSSIKTLVKRRRHNKRIYLWIFLLSMALYSSQRDEKSQAYLYMGRMFKWSVGEFSTFKTFQSSLQVASLLILVPFFNKVLKLSDTFIIMIGTIGHATARLFFIFAKEIWVIYIGGALSGFGPIVAPGLRALTSKVVPLADRGKIFSLLSAADNAVPLISGTIYNQVYKRTIHSFPQAIFLVTIIMQAIIFILILAVQCTASNESLLPDTENIQIQDDSEETVAAEQ